MQKSIYESPEVEARLMAIYDARIEKWPVTYESFFVDTNYGKVHVIASGPHDGQSALLLHAANISAWSWLYNIQGLNKHYRTYAIDHIGDVGKSVLTDLNRFPQDGKALSDLYSEISDKIEIGRAYVIGASNGGYIATNYALHAPERVFKIALLGPMGLTPATESTVQKIAEFTASKEQMVRWVLGANPRVLEFCGEWLRLVMGGVKMRINAPLTFTPEQLQRLSVPVLLVLGTKDPLVGDPVLVKQLARHVPDIQIEVLDTGHLISAEQPETVNTLIHEFFNH